MGERHFQGVEREVDVGAILVAARRHVALHQADGVLRQRAAVLTGARPVGVGDFGNHLAALLDGIENDPDVELLAERGLDADLDVVEVAENGDVETILMRQNWFLAFEKSIACSRRTTAAGGSSQRSSVHAANLW